MSEDCCEARKLTLGERYAGVGFNPSGDADVAKCKRGFADLIDQLVGIAENDAAKRAICDTAITEIMTAQMWAVKAITWRG